LAHHPGGFLTGNHHAAHVHIQGAVQVIDTEFLDGRHRQYTGIVHQNIETAEGLYRMANGGADSLLVPAVGLDGNGTTTGGFSGPDYIMGTGGGGNIGQGNMRALLGQAQGNGGANAPGAALDEGDFAFELFIDAHLEPPEALGLSGTRLQYSPATHNR